MKTNIYNVDYFIKKFTAIPEERWVVGIQHDGDGRHCAFGWCRTDEDLNKEAYPGFSGADTVEGKSLIFLFRMLYEDSHGRVAAVNNGGTSEYQQPTPKQRILAALYDIYEKTYGRKYSETVEPKEVVRYKTVVIDSAVKTLQETLSEN